MPDYRVELPNTDPVMVRASNKAQAIRFVTHKKVAIEILTTEDAIKLAKAGQELLDATGEPDEEPQAPLLAGPAGSDQSGTGAGEGEEGNAGSGPAADGATTTDADQPGASGTSSTQTDEVEEKPAKGKK